MDKSKRAARIHNLPHERENDENDACSEPGNLAGHGRSNRCGSDPSAAPAAAPRRFSGRSSRCEGAGPASRERHGRCWRGDKGQRRDFGLPQAYRDLLRLWLDHRLHGQNHGPQFVQAPQDPAKNDGAYLDEPVGKKAYKNGVLEWRKDTETIAGGHAPCPDKVVYYDGKWMGYLSNKAACQPGKIVTISVTFLYNSQQGQAWIDEYIDKLTEALSSKKPVRCGATGPTLAGSHSEVNSRAAIEGVGQP
jgi:hypothetical protein